ncbi:MAG: DUF481 domain-containing protein [Gammaproteobacteria bacterium]|nr:DUF481 domain-containing protein [Gammaproteobacteria bacterium]
MKISVPVIILPIFFSAQALAETTSATDAWKASAEIGYVSTSGNTETSTLNAKAMATNENAQWRHKIEATTLNASDAVKTTAKKFTLEGQSDYKLQQSNYLFGVVAYEDDKFSGYDYRLTESIGYGHRVVDQTDLSLDLEIGPGARQSKLDNGDSENEALLRGAAKLGWNISKTSKFAENFSVEVGEDVTVSKSVSSLSSQIDGNLSMKLTFTYKNTSSVPVGFDETDTETGVTLVYTF